jgi:hypothetical protein
LRTLRRGRYVPTLIIFEYRSVEEDLMATINELLDHEDANERLVDLAQQDRHLPP